MYLHFSRLLLKLCCFSERQWGSSALCYKIYLTNREAWAVYMFGQSAHAVLTIKEWKARSNIWEFWVLSRWRSTQTQAPRIQNRGRFRRSIIVQTSRPLGKHVLALVKLPDPWANIYVQSLLKFPTWDVHERSKSPPYPVVPHLGHNIDSCIRGYAVIQQRKWELGNKCSISTDFRTATCKFYFMLCDCI